MASGAQAATFCAGAGTNSNVGACDSTLPGIPAALGAATGNPGPDVVLIPAGDYVFDSGLDYSDAGQAANGVTIQGAPGCERYGCGHVRIRGGAPGGTLLAFSGDGGAEVRVLGVELLPDPGATGLVLPPGSHAGASVSHVVESTGVRIEGTASRPATFGGTISGLGVAVDAPGHGILVGTFLAGDVGARVRGDGALDIRGGQIEAPLAVTGPRALVTGVAVNLVTAGPGGGSPVGFEATCAGADSADAELSLTNVTLLGSDAPDSTGARSVARGGDGESCDASVRLNSTVIHGVATALDARGEPGTGADPRVGTARIHAQYSAFDPSRSTSTGPAVLDTSNPGGNVSGDPRFYRDIVWFPYLYWDSPLIDRGDPADPEPWQEDYTPVIHGRRDIGRYEYGWQPPIAQIEVSPDIRVGIDEIVRLTAGAGDNDPGDPVAIRWTLSDGTSSTDREVFPNYTEFGAHTERVTVTDGAGLSTEDSVTITVARQRVTGLSIDPQAFRASRSTARRARRATIGYAVSVRGSVRFRVDRLRPSRASRRGRRWVRMRGSFGRLAEAGHSSLRWGGWIGGHRLRPGRYRLVATASTDASRRARFRIIR
jgi:hypothetical protein